jgi:hypothetical protein
MEWLIILLVMVLVLGLQSNQVRKTAPVTGGCGVMGTLLIFAVLGLMVWGALSVGTLALP